MVRDFNFSSINAIILTVVVVNSKKMNDLVRGVVNLLSVLLVIEVPERMHIKGTVKIKVNGVLIVNGSFVDEVPVVVFSISIVDISITKLKER